MKFHHLLAPLIATNVLAAPAAEPRDGQAAGLRGVGDRNLKLFGGAKSKSGKSGDGDRGGDGGDGGGGGGGGGPKQRESTGRVIICRKSEAKLKMEGKKDEEIKELLDRGMNEVQKESVVFESLGEGGFEVVDVGRGNEQSYIASMMGGPNKDLFEYVEEDLIEYPIETTPNDPLLNNQYHHDNMQSRLAWDLTTGSDQVTVAICDTGLQLDHPDLAANRLPGYHATTQCWEGDSSCDDDVSAVHPHGTNCAGCAAAVGNNAAGLAGVGWGFRHRPGRVSDVASGGASSSVLADCARRMCELPDVKVASVSYSGVESQSRRDAATYCKSQGALMVNAAGNDSRDLTQFGEADADDLIVAGASTSFDTKSGFSAYGRFVDVWAPGSSVWTTTTNSGYTAVSGTSFSCPLVAGLIALIWSANPTLSPDEVETILKTSTDNVGIQGQWNTAYGRINSYKAVVAAGAGSMSPTSNPTTPPPTMAPEPIIQATFVGTSPRCTAVGGGCSSGTLLNSRGTLSPAETNAPNTIDGCDDGNAGSYHNDESLDAIEVSAVGGGFLRVGRTAVIKATVWAWNSGSSDTADFYVAEGDSNPTWSYVGSVGASTGGGQVIESAAFELTSTLMTARVRFRYNGSPDPCSNGSYDDADDLVFAVATSDAPPTPATPPPTPNPTTAPPTSAPTPSPTTSPTPSPTNGPTTSPTMNPTAAPTRSPTQGPTASPTDGPTPGPTSAPTSTPTGAPTGSPTSATPIPTPSPNPLPATETPTFFTCSQFNEHSCASAYGGGQCQWLGTCHNCGCVLTPRLSRRRRALD